MYDSLYDFKPVSSYVPLPLDAIMKAGEMKQENQDKANAERMDFYGKQVQALKKDVPLVTQEKQKIDSELNDKWGNVDFNDPTVRHEWAQRKRELANEYGPQGKLGIVQQNYLAAQAYQKELDDKLDKKEIDQVQHDKLLAMSHDSYKGAENGSFNGITAAYDPKINEQATALTANWKTNGTDNGYTWENGQWVKHTTKGTEYISDNEVYNHLMNTLMEDPANKAYAQQQADIAMYGQNYSTESGGHLGVDGGGNTVEYAPGNEQTAKESIHNKIVYDMFDKSAKLAAARTGFVKTKNDETWDADQFKLKKYGHDLDNTDEKITSDINRDSFGSEFNAPEKFDQKYQELKDRNSNIITKASQAVDNNGNKILTNGQIQLLKLISEGNTNIKSNEFAANETQQAVIDSYLSDINQNQVTERNTREKEKASKIASGLGEDWKPNARAIVAGDYYKQDIANTEKTIEYLRGAISRGVMPEVNKGQLEEYKVILSDLNKKKVNAMKKEDPLYAKYERYLDENSKNSTETVGLTSISDKDLRTNLKSIIETDLTTQGGTGAKDFKTGIELKDEQYAQVGKIDPNSIRYYFDKGEARIVIRPEIAGDKTGAKMDYIDIKAPHGVREHILNNGTQLGAQMIIKSIVADVTTPDTPTIVPIGKNNVTVTKMSNTDIANLSDSDRNANRIYNVTLRGITYPHSKQEVITQLVDLEERNRLANTKK